MMMPDQGASLPAHSYHAHPLWDSPPPVRQSGNSTKLAQLLQRHSWPEPEQAQSAPWDVSSATMPPCLVGAHRADLLPLPLHQIAAPGDLPEADLSDDGVLMAMCTELLEGASGTGACVLNDMVADSCRSSVAAGSHRPQTTGFAAPAPAPSPDSAAGLLSRGHLLRQAEASPVSAGPSSASRSRSGSTTPGLSQLHAAEPSGCDDAQHPSAPTFGTHEQYCDQCPLGKRTLSANEVSPELKPATPALPVTDDSLSCLIPETQSQVMKNCAPLRQLDSPDRARLPQAMQIRAGSSTPGSFIQQAEGRNVPDCTLDESSLRILAERMSTVKTSPRKRKASSRQLCAERAPIFGSTVLSLPQDGPHHPAGTPLSQGYLGQAAQPDDQLFFRGSLHTKHAAFRSCQQDLLSAGRLHSTSLAADMAMPAALKPAAIRTVSQQVKVMTQHDEQLPAACPQRASRQKAAESAVDWSDYWPPNALKRRVKAERKASRGTKIKPAWMPTDLKVCVPLFTETNPEPSPQAAHAWCAPGPLCP